jgi:competence protein ComEC
MKGYRGNIYEKNSVKIQYPQDNGEKNKEFQNFWKKKENKISLIPRIKKTLQEKIKEIYGEERNAGLLLGMLIGDRSQIPQSDYQTFIESGLVHIIAVSGGNIIMIVVFLSFVLFFLPFYLRNIVILVLVIGYALLCGMDSSVLRAVLFAALGILALFKGKEVYFWRSITIVFGVMLIINPYFLVYDLGFLLSFGAVIGLKIFDNKIKY